MGKPLQFRRRKQARSLSSRSRRTRHGAELENGLRRRRHNGPFISSFEWGGTLIVGLLVGLASTLLGWPNISQPHPFSAQFAQQEKIHFSLCHTGGGINCVVDGDTVWIRGVKIRIADIDTPETHPPRCTTEAELGSRATLRLQALLNAGSITLEPIDRDEDRYGRKLRIVKQGGRSVGDILVAEGLARRYGGGARSGWCG